MLTQIKENIWNIFGAIITAVLLALGASKAAAKRKAAAKKEKRADELMNSSIEKDIEAGKMHGFTSNYIRVAVDYLPEYVNQLVRVKLDEVGPNGVMRGTVVEKAAEVLS